MGILSSKVIGYKPAKENTTKDKDFNWTEYNSMLSLANTFKDSIGVLINKSQQAYNKEEKERLTEELRKEWEQLREINHLIYVKFYK